MQIPRETKVILVLRTLNSLGWSATMPFLAVYLEVARGMSLSVIGVVYLASGLLTLGSQLLGGRLTDSIGPKKVMLSGYIASFISSILLGYLIQVDAQVSLLLLLYPIFSLVRGISQPATSAIVANQKQMDVRTGFSLLTIGGNLGFAIGPAIGGLLANAYGYATVFLLSALASLVVTSMAAAWIEGGLLTTRRGAHRDESKLSPVKRWLSWKYDRNIILFLVLTMCAFFAVGYEITPLSLYVAGFLHFPNDEIGYLFATNGLVIVLLQLPLTKLMERSRSLLLPLSISGLLSMFAFLVASASTTFLQMELFMFIITLGEIFLTVPSQTVVALLSTVGNRGTYQGYYSAFSSSGRSLASFVGPLSFDLLAFDPSIAWYLIASFALLVALGFGLLSPKLQRDYERLQRLG